MVNNDKALYGVYKFNHIRSGVGVDSTPFSDFAKFCLISVFRDCLTFNLCPSGHLKSWLKISIYKSLIFEIFDARD